MRQPTTTTHWEPNDLPTEDIEALLRLLFDAHVTADEAVAA